MEVFKWLTIGIIAIVAIIIISVIVIRVRQNRRLNEARVRGIKSALKEQRQYEMLRKLEGTEEEYSKKQEKEYISKRREIRR